MVYKGKELKTVGEIFDEALRIAKTGDQNEADNFAKEYASYCAEANGITFEEGMNIVKSNLGYFAGYFNRETCDIIYKTYKCTHPVFNCNPFDVSPEDAFNAGYNRATKK